MASLNWKSAVPWSMVVFRTILSPAVVLVAWRLARPELWLGLMITAAFFSDVYDGILARRWGTATARLRIGDSVADIIFYLGVLAAIIERHWPELHQRMMLLGAVIALELLRAGFDWIKFGRMSSYHTYAAKLWGISLAAAAVSALCLNGGYWLLSLSLVLGVVCDLEGLAISLVLPEWVHDVKSLRIALALRGKMLNQR